MNRLIVQGASRGLRGKVTVPGDKSISHRAVMFAALTEGTCRIRNLSAGEDNRRTVDAFRALGVKFEQSGDAGHREWVVTGRGLDGLQESSAAIDCGNSGTSMRLLAGILAGQRFASNLHGDEYLHRRPMRRVVDPLLQMGAKISGQSGAKANEIYAPLHISPPEGRLAGIDYASAIASAQMKSALLLAGLWGNGIVNFSEPHRSRDHTERMLISLGAPLQVAGTRVTLDTRGWNRKLKLLDYDVPGDLSSAAFLLGAALVVKDSEIEVTSVGVNPTRTGFCDALHNIAPGCIETIDGKEVSGEPVATLYGRSVSAHGVKISGELTLRSIDEIPLLAALAAHTHGQTLVEDAAELRVKESDRIASTVAMLHAFGVDAVEQESGFIVTGGGRLRPAVVNSHGDHRIAMAAAVCALGVAGETVIEDAANVRTSFPQFADTLRALGADITWQ